MEAAASFDVSRLVDLAEEIRCQAVVCQVRGGEGGREQARGRGRGRAGREREWEGEGGRESGRVREGRWRGRSRARDCGRESAGT